MDQCVTVFTCFQTSEAHVNRHPALIYYRFLKVICHWADQAVYLRSSSNYLIILPHRRSTIVSLETSALYLKSKQINCHFITQLFIASIKGFEKQTT